MQFHGLSDTLRPVAIAFIALVLSACGSGDGEDPVRAPGNDVAAAKQVLVFRDDFGGPAVGARSAPRGAAARIAPAALPSGNWVVETGYGQNGWGNDEWQRYTNSMDNLFTEDGSLVIRAKCATAPACGKRDDSITSARIITKDRLNVRYGSIKARIKMPSGLGMWPAFWTLGADIDERRWPNAGEIDIVEMHYFFSDPFTTHFATHWAGPRYTAANRPACASGVPAIDPDEEENCKTASKTFDQPLTDDFHIYELVWNPNQIVGKIDGIIYFTQAIDPRTMEEFLKEHYLLLNVAVGGTLGGPFGPAMSAADWADPDQTDMLVDWVEVYEFVPPSSGTLIDESGRNLKYNRIINSVEVGGAFVEFDLDSTAVPPLVGSSSLELKYSKSVSKSGGITAGFSAAIFDFNNVNLSSFTHFNFSLDSSRFPNFDDIGIEFEDSLNRKKLLRTSDYTPVATSGSWRTYSVPLGDFSPVDMNAIIKIGFFNPNDAADALIAGTLYVDDIVFTTRACTPGATVAFDSINYNPATSVAQVSVSDACKANKLVTVKVENGSDEIYVGVKLDAAGNGSEIFGLISPISVCPTDDSQGYIALSPPLIATYTNSSGGVSYTDTATAGVDAGAPGTSLEGAREFFYATDPNQPLAFVPDAPVTNSFNFSAFGSGSVFDGAFADTTFNPVFQVRSGAGYGAEVAQLVLINIPQGFAADAESINFKFKNVGHPLNSIRVEFGELGVTSNLVLVDLADSSRSTPLGDGWFQVSLPMSAFPDATNFNYFGFITTDPAPPIGSGFYFLITDIHLQESLGSIDSACAAPIAPAAAPTQDPAEVISLFSNAYSDVMVDTWSTVWDSTEVADVVLQGNDIKRYPGIGFAGIETVVMPIDASGMTNFRIDAWSTGITSLRVKLVDFGGDGFGGGNDTEGFVDLPLTEGEWTSLDISLASLVSAGLNPAKNDISQYILEAVGGSGTLFIDNVYFYNIPAPPTELGVFSETFTDPAIALGPFINSIAFGGNDTVATPVVADLAGNGVTAFDGNVLEIDYQNTGGSFGGALFDLGGADLSSYTALRFSIDTSQFAGFANLTIQIEPPGGPQPGNNVALASYTPVFTAGTWSTYEIPLADFPGATLNAVNVIGFWNARDVGDALVFGKLYLDDVHLVGPTTLGLFSEANGSPSLPLGPFINSSSFGGNNTVATPVVANPAVNGVTAFDGNVLEIDYRNTGGSFGGALFNFGGVDVTPYATLKFSIDTSQFADFANLTIQVEPPGGPQPGNNVALSGYTPVSTAGSWSTYEIPLADFPGATLSAVGVVGFWNARDIGDALVYGKLYLDDVHFTVTPPSGGGGGGSNLAADGDFEAGDLALNWVVDNVGGSGVAVADNTENNGGSWSASLNVVGGPPLIVKQVNMGQGTVVTNDTIDVSFDVKGVIGPTCALNFKLIYEGSGAGTPTIPPNLNETSDLTNWTPVSFSGVAVGDVAGGVTLEFTASCGPGPGEIVDVNIDNVSVVIQ